MAVIVVSTITNERITLSAADEYFLLEGVLHHFSNAPIWVTPSTNGAPMIHVNGTLAATGGNAITTYSVPNVSIVVGQTGQIATPGVFLSVVCEGAHSVLTNHGTISGGAPRLAGENSRFINTGTLTGLYNSPTTLPVAALRMEGLDAFVSNSGQMTALIGAVIRLERSSQVFNSGTISGRQDGIDGSAIPGGETPESLRLSNSGTIEAGRNAILGGASGDHVTNTGTVIGNVLLGGGDDRFDASGAGLVVGSVQGGTGFDFLRGAAAEDQFFGEEGNDFLAGRGGDDTLSGGAGDDVIYGGAGNDQIEGGDGNDLVHGGAGDDTLRGNAGNDLMFGGDGNDDISDSFGRDTIHGGDGDDTIRTGAGGGDTIFGGRGDDVIDTSNGAGWDRLDGGAGDDTMTSGGGNDIFVFRRGMGDDVITDLQNNADRLDLSTFGIADFATLTGAGAITGDATQTVINLAALGIAGTITLDGFALAQLDATDFIF
ncbi:calcium-binding protein [Thetidibacter halocola]|uniref:Calcium-binding protein n=1 Tax=Thetidibacter halocola TaxID=2827239 RepID=A0A8J8B7Q2_9RHOB|nr:calcium-binding protein [Thetidibacter halocola]MBS0124652.1 hypothetical protein [Thetidibacter halocola]